jgi:hypothetical protein
MKTNTTPYCALIGKEVTISIKRPEPVRADMFVIDELPFIEHAPGNERSISFERPEGVKWFDAVPSADGLSVEFYDLPEPAGVSIGYMGPFPVCPEEEVTRRLEWDLFYPSGSVSVVRDEPEPKMRDVVVIGHGRGQPVRNGVMAALLAALGATGQRVLYVSDGQHRAFRSIGVDPDYMEIVRPFQFAEGVNPVKSKHRGLDVSHRSRAGKANRWR